MTLAPGVRELPLAVSNIAWPANEETAVADKLKSLDVRFVEIAPTKVFADPISTTKAQRLAYIEFWAERNIAIVAFQSMLFGRADLQVFGTAAVRSETIEVLSRFIELAGALGAGTLVFGSPKNRIVPADMEPAEATDIAVDFFRTLGQVALDNNTSFCIEPNPTIYDCNFVTTAAAGLDLVRTVDHSGFDLHLDVAGMTLQNDPIADSIHNASTRLRHFHASAPFLGALEETVVNHATAAHALRGIHYPGYVSIEMRPGPPGMGPTNVADAIRIARKYYAETPS